MELIGLQVKLQLDCIFGLLGSSVNFINVKRAHFLYERLFSSYVLALNELSYEKFVRLTLMKLTAVHTFTQQHLVQIVLHFYR